MEPGTDMGQWRLRFQDGEFWVQSTKDLDDDGIVEDITGYNPRGKLVNFR
jgi:hypothetical protein